MMRYAQLLSELRGFEAMAMYYSNMVLWKTRELEQYLSEVMGTALPELAEVKVEQPVPVKIMQITAPDEPERMTLHEHKKKIIAECLARHNGNIKNAAAELNISRNFFYRGLPVNGDHEHA